MLQIKGWGMHKIRINSFGNHLLHFAVGLPPAFSIDQVPPEGGNARLSAVFDHPFQVNHVLPKSQPFYRPHFPNQLPGGPVAKVFPGVHFWLGSEFVLHS